MSYSDYVKATIGTIDKISDFVRNNLVELNLETISMETIGAISKKTTPQLDNLVTQILDGELSKDKREATLYALSMIVSATRDVFLRTNTITERRGA